MTLAEVARAAGVSLATASVSLAGRPSGNCRVSRAVAERVRRAAAELGYRPNLSARSLVTRRTRTVAILVSRATWHNAMFYLAAAQRLLREAGLTEFFLLHRDNRLESERQHLDECLNRGAEGILMLPLIDLAGATNAAAIDAIATGAGVPVVQLGLALPDCAAPAVVTDEAAGFATAVRQLHARGHRRIVHATLHRHADPNPANPYRHAHLRYVGYRAAVADLGLAEQVVCPPEITRGVDGEFESARRLAADLAAWLAREPDEPTAVLAYSDYLAAGLLAGFCDAGVRVPEQVSVVGYGDQPFGRMTRPALSTLSPPYELMGETATRLLLDRLDDGRRTGRVARTIAIPPELIWRQSAR